ncbi:MAG: Ig domain-containing protein, partial [Terriglobales bacterium]
MKLVCRCAVAAILSIVSLTFLSSLGAAQSLTVSCASPIAEQGVAYSSAVVASGGVAPYTFSLATGKLDAGLTLDPSSGDITGTPSKVFVYNYKAKATDSTGKVATATCRLQVYVHVSIDCPKLNTGAVGEPFSVQLPVYGGVAPFTFAIIAGALPPGLMLNSSTGLISGTPTTGGNFFYTAQVTDSLGAFFDLKCEIKIVQPISLGCAGGSGQVGVAYSSALVVKGGVPPYSFSIIGGSLPPGLVLNPSTGAITGTPTTYGAFNFTAQVVDSTGSAAGTATANCVITIAPPAISLICPSNSAQAGVPYSSALVATGGAPPYTFTITSGSLPPGLVLNPSTGAITGTPTTGGTFNFTAQVVDSTGTAAGTATASCSIVVAAPVPALVCPTATGTVGVAYSSSLVATGGVPPYTFSITSGSLPPGLTLNPSTGAITGTPTTAGTFNFTAQVVDSRGTAAGTTTSSCSIMIAPAAPTLACATATGQVGVAYSSALVAVGGVPPYTFSITSGSLPTGLTLNPSTGAITGTPSAYGTFNFTAQVVDSRGTAAGTTVSNCSIVIAPPQITLTCPPATTGTVGVAYSSSLTAGGGIPPYTYSITSGSLPAGLTLNSSTGAITGTPTTAGTFNFTAQVVDSTGTAAGTTTSNCSIGIAPAPPTLTCPTATGQVGAAYSSALVAAGGVPPYTYSITAGSLPAGLTLNSTTGAIAGTPTSAGTFNFTAQVVDSRGTAAGTTTSGCSIVIAPAPPTLTCPTATGQVGVAYSSALVAGGGVPPYTFSITSGSLPPGLTLNPSTGAITGTPTTYGTFNFTAQVVDSRGTAAGTSTSTSNCSIVIAPPQITLACPAATTGTVGIAYSSSLTAGGGIPPYTYSITSGSLPAGLTLNSSTGAITGTPTTAGTFNFTAQVVDSTGTAAGTTTSNCSIVIAPAPPTLTCPTATGQVGTAYSSALVAAGGVSPYTFSITSGSLPPGLTLNSTTGAITGTPTTAGSFNFTAQVVDSRNNAAGTNSTNCTIVIAPAPPTLACAGATGQVGTAYGSSLVAGGGVPPYTFSITSGSLPPGLTLNSSTGAITGTPTTAGTFNFTAQVVDSRGTAAGTTTSSCSIVIAPAPPTLTCPTATGQVGTAYSSALLAAGGVPPYTFSITGGALPDGLTLNTSTGAITGTPTTAGTFNFTAQVVDSRGTTAGTTTSSCSIVIAPAPPTLTCPTATGQVGVAYISALVAAGGVSPYTFSITAGSLPAGLTLNSTTGAITGTPTTAGTFNFTAQVVDSRGTAAGTTTSSCTIVIAPAPPTLTCPTATGQVGVAYTSALVAAGGVSPYTFSITAGSLPAGLTLNSTTGA